MTQQEQANEWWSNKLKPSVRHYLRDKYSIINLTITDTDKEILNIYLSETTKKENKESELTDAWWSCLSPETKMSLAKDNIRSAYSTEKIGEVKTQEEKIFTEDELKAVVWDLLDDIGLSESKTKVFDSTYSFIKLNLGKLVSEFKNKKEKL